MYKRNQETVDKLVKTLRENNGFVIKTTTLDDRMAHAYAFTPTKTPISPFAFMALEEINVLSEVSVSTKNGLKTYTYRVV